MKASVTMIFIYYIIYTYIIHYIYTYIYIERDLLL